MADRISVSVRPAPLRATAAVTVHRLLSRHFGVKQSTCLVTANRSFALARPLTIKQAVDLQDAVPCGWSV